MVKSSDLSGPIILYTVYILSNNRPKLNCYFRVAVDITYSLMSFNLLMH